MIKFLKDPEVHQQFQTYVVPVAKGFYDWYNGPSKQNKTVEEIEVRHRDQAAETADERERRTANEREALAEQQREEEELAKNEESIALRITDKKRELVLLKKVILRLRERDLLFQAEQRDARARAAEDTAAEDTEAHRAAIAAEMSRIEMTRILAEATNQVQETNRATDEFKERTEARRIQLVRDMEDKRRYELYYRRFYAAKQTAERRTAADKKQWADAVKGAEAANQRKIDDASKLHAAIEKEHAAALDVADLKEARRQNTGKIALATWPHPAEYEAAKEKIQFDPSTFMFAIAGFTGTGKSSLINIFLDRDPPTKDAEISDNDGARTGTCETTSEITRYPDPGDKPPRKWIVWYDVPGGGTSNIPEKQYFNHQSLFLMDVILVLIGNRFTSIDVQILKQCRAFGIPSMIVRSNTDTHIANMVKVRAERLDVEPNDALRSKCRAEYIADTRDNIAVQLQKHSLPPQYVYLVTCLPSKQFRKAYSAFAGGAPYEGTSHFIDEMKLILDLTIAANKRRGRGMPGDEGGTPRDVLDLSTSVYQYLANTLLHR